MKFLFGFIGKFKVARLLLAVMTLSVLDLLGIAIIFPYLKVITDPAVVQTNTYARAMYGLFEFRNEVQFTYALSACLLLLFTAKTALALLLNRFQSRGMAEITRRLSSTLFGMLMRARYDFFLKRAPSELMGMNYSYASQAVVCFQAWLGVLNESVFFLFVLIAALYIDPFATALFAGVFGIFVGFLYVLVVERVARYGGAQQRLDSAMHSLNFATVSSVKDMKIMGLGDMFYARTEELAVQRMEINWRFSFAAILPRITIEYIIMSSFVIMAVLFVLPGVEAKAMLPVLGLMGLAAIRILPAFGRLTGHYSSFKYSKNYLDRLEEFYETLASNRQEIRHVNAPFTKSIVLDAINFSYADKEVLKDLCMAIPRGASVGIVGASGSGKSTLLDVITGLQEKRSGRFLLDDIEVDPYSSDAIRQHVGYVPQQIALIDESIAFNIAFTHKYDAEKIKRVLKTANLGEFVASLPQGIETFVGESGARLSGGQKQRLGIARALYRDPDILIFDESTSALDNITEKELAAEILTLTGRKTLIIVAHRLTTVMGCDVIYVMDQGRIVAQGTHSQLLESCALYNDMNFPQLQREANLCGNA
jgi:ABC-type bacteriocin/lantibiotic exporter with double-glycine peptidase domain